MCSPIAPAVALGIATFATSAVGSIASYTQTQNQARAQAQAQNEYQQKQYALQTQAWQQQEAAASRQEQLNREAASKAYVSAQLKIHNEYQKSAVEADNLRLKAMRDAANIQASGKTGRSIGILAMDPDREYGRDLATLGLNLGYAKDDYFQSIDSIFDQATTANNQVASSRSTAPKRPTMVKPQGPSTFGLVAGLAEAGFEGYKTGAALTAPKGFEIPSPSPPPSGTNHSLLGFKLQSSLI